MITLLMIEGKEMTLKTWKMETATPQVLQTHQELEDKISSRGKVKIHPT